MNEHKAEFWLCLARAFLPPVTEAAQQALRDDFADTLEEVAAQAGYSVQADIESWRSAIAAVPDGETLLAIYSRLFLVPGTAHPQINAAVYLDGTIHGGTVRQLAECYRRCGLEKSEALHDLPDHVAVQLEFVAWLFAAAAEAGDAGGPPISPGQFITGFVARWAPLLCSDLEQAGARFALAVNPWLPLARILSTVAAIEAEPATKAEVDSEDEIRRLRREYAGRMPDADDLARIRACLQADGLASDHIELPAGLRDQAAGLTPMSPPAPPRHSLHTP